MARVDYGPPVGPIAVFRNRNFPFMWSARFHTPAAAGLLPRIATDDGTVIRDPEPAMIAAIRVFVTRCAPPMETTIGSREPSVELA